MIKLATFHIFGAVAAIRVTQNSGEWGVAGAGGAGEERIPNAQCPKIKSNINNKVKN
ncbi:MAG: hypothetical protein V7L04_19615 [Nostoc sp.]|uniref:hypothetical protein n=1 Tax=Nostoc sp. TaxID=1180 RepID=UPI002FF5EE6C